MRRAVPTITLAMTAALSSVIAFAPAAHAGGPTSVVITDPSAGRATALYYSDRVYEKLAGLVDDATPLPRQPSSLGGRAINLTWLIHDVQPWQTQQLYTDSEKGPVVVSYGTQEVGNAEATTWSRPADGKALVRLVDRLFARGGGSGAPVPQEAPPRQPAVVERVVTEQAWFSLAGWRWIVPGVVLGATAALLLTRRPADQEPRQQLIDLEA